MVDHDAVRPSRDGDQFHYHWAARQCLVLLSEGSNLVAVTIEGPSVIEEDSSVNAGSELIDVGLYYGAEALDSAQCVRYIQLKHSTRQELNDWTVSGLEKTIRGFAQRYENLLRRFSFAELKKKVRFEFTTNRPINSKLLETIDDLKKDLPTRHPGIRKTVVAYTNLNEAQAEEFFKLFYADGQEPNLWMQRNLLAQDLYMYLAEADYDSPVQLKELVTRKATTEFESNPAIRKHDVLRVLKVRESDLLPAPCQIKSLKEFLPREQEGAILDVLLNADHPIIIHADGGIGKSILALRLASSMPSGSVAVVYDCFGNGLYRNAFGFRHRHRDAFVQISNELAGQGLCHPLIPSIHADVKQYTHAFCGRLKQAITILRAREPNANLCLFIDAADNASIAAEERREVSFIQDLIRVPLPNGVRLAFTCRTHRRDRLAAPPEAQQIELRPFTEVETALHLHSVYSDATKEEVAEFAFLSSSNPRVQALALEGGLMLQDMLKELGPAPSTVDRAIGALLQRAMDKLKDQAGATEKFQIDLICQGLAILRPLVPIAILAEMAGVPESAVRSFALDLGRPIFVKGNSLHFFDEPAETWFRERFKPNSHDLVRFLTRLRPLSKTNSYVAYNLPQLLLDAGQTDELIELALSAASLPTNNPLERRDVELQRLLFALKVCLEQGRYGQAAKLALKAGGESAGQSRQIRLIQENTDISAVLLSNDHLDEIVSRRTFGSTWIGSYHIYEAGLLSGHSEFFVEAGSRLRMAMDWLHAWANCPQDRSPQKNINDADRTEFAMAMLRLRGPQAAAHFLRSWTQRRYAFVSGRHLARRLVDLGHQKQLDLLAYAAGNDIWLLLGLAIEVETVGYCLPLEPLKRLLRLLADRRIKLSESKHWDSKWDILYAVQSAVTLALRTLPQDNARWGAILRRYLPEKPPGELTDQFGFDCTLMLRAYALEAALRGYQLRLNDIAPLNIRKQPEGKGTSSRSQELSAFQYKVGGLIPWCVLGAEITCGRTPSDLNAQIGAALKETANAESSNYQRSYSLRQTVAIQWLRILRDASAKDAFYMESLRAWLARQDPPLWSITLTLMCRLAARTDGLESMALEFANAACDSLEQLRDDDAETKVESYKSLSRAIVSVSRVEAGYYFNRAIEISSRIGSENLNRWSAFIVLAKAAAKHSEPNPKSAYCLARTAELVYQYVERDKHFNWLETIEALADLAGVSILAILSRWRDRKFGQAEKLLPIAVYRLIQQGHLSVTIPIALSGIKANWNRLDDLKHFIKAENQPLRQSLGARIAYRYMRLQNYDVATWAALNEISTSLRVELPDVARLLAFSRKEESQNKRQVLIVGDSEEVKSGERREPNWERFFDGVDMANSAELRKSYADMRNYDKPYQFEAFFREGLRRAGVVKAPEFVSAIAAWPDFDAKILRRLLNVLLESSLNMRSLRSAIEKAVMIVCRREPWSIPRRGYGAEPFEHLISEGIIHEHNVVQATLEGYAAHVDILSASSLFQLVDPLASCLSPNEADDALNFGLGLLEEVLRPEDGDGPWCDNLQPPSAPVAALAGYIWVGLGSPRVDERWEFAHVVRTCVELDWSDLLSALAQLATGKSALPFFDRALVFYEWHARQWLLIGLARGALEQPRCLYPLIPFFWKSKDEEHVLIRAFAGQALKALHAAGVIGGENVESLDSINQTNLPLDIYTGWRAPIIDENNLEEPRSSDDEKYYFGIDIIPYWFAPLGRAFGISEATIEKHAREVLRQFWGGSSGRARDDARYKRKIFNEYETIHSHGRMPQTDDLGAYQSYHAIMLVAARLLSKWPVRKFVDDSKDEFQKWINNYLLTRPDGHWVADRRDPKLVIESRCENSTWCWDVTGEYLDQQLMVDDDFYALWGYWSTGQKERHETISIRSALVSRNGAKSLLAALQTAPQTDRFVLPSAGDAKNLEGGYLQLWGWVIDDNEIPRCDENDPWAEALCYPGPTPCVSIVEKLALISSSDRRCWAAESNTLLRSESWVQVSGYGIKQEKVTGTRLSSNLKFIRLLLERYPNHCLILSVSVRRLPTGHSEEDDFEPYPWPYVRYYLMDNDGIARSL